MTNDDEERAPLISPYPPEATDEERTHRTRRLLSACGLLALFLVVLGLALGLGLGAIPDRGEGDPHAAARDVLARAPIIDGHIDLPILMRELYSNNISAINLRERMPGHVDIPRLREGRVGGFFWSVYVGCKPDNEDFTRPSYRVRDTLEQIDVARLLIDAYPETFKLATSTSDIHAAIREGKIASLLGVEGGHQLGNSLGVLRQYHALGVRYVTLTHGCHNAFADSGGILVAPPPLHGGLSTLGVALVKELTRLGMLVDISHVSDATADQAITLAAARGAPVLWSHSSARAVHDVARNVPDWLLQRLSTTADASAGTTDGVVMVNFAPQFVGPDAGGLEADLKQVADHVEHIGKVAGREHVGLGSDYDGIGSVPEGLEDVSKYPDLVAELYTRGWSRAELAGLTSGNVLRVFKSAEDAARNLAAAGARPAMDVYEKRTDL
ncbi:hypothetical protein M0805_005860 [Coniferiporia weirii]|nr:hypothetical protein M0805_005860 [Coniferiporia weirii]